MIPPLRSTGPRASRTLGGATALALGLGVLCSTALGPAAHAAPLASNPLAGLAGFTVVSAGDLVLANHELEGSAAAAGDVRVESGQPYTITHSVAGNPDYTLPRAADGTYYRLVVDGTFEAVGTGSLLRVTSGGNPGTPETQGAIAVRSNGELTVTERGLGVCVRPQSIPDCSGPTLEQTTVSQNVGSVILPGLINEFIDAQARRSLVEWSDRIAADAIIGSVPVTLRPAGSDYALDLTAGAVNVWTVSAADLPSGDWKLAFGAVTPSADTPLVVRIVAADGAVVRLPAETIGFQDAPGGPRDDRYAPYMLWSIEQSAGQSVSVTSSGIVPGSILAPRSALTTGPGKTLIEGQIYAAEVALRNDGEIHHYAFVPELPYDDGAVVTPATGGFTLRKILDGPAGLVPVDTTFLVEYSIDGGPAQVVTVHAGGTTIRVDGLRAGSTVTFTEASPPSIAGVTWGSAVFSSPTIVIGSDQIADVELTNTFTAAASTVPTLTSRAYVAGVANGTLTSSGTPIVDRVAYSGLRAGEQYTMRGELAFVSGGAVHRTGITSSVTIDTAATGAAGSVDAPFWLTPARLAELAGTRLLVIEELYDASNTLVAFEGPSDAADPWITTTSQWVRVAAAPVTPVVPVVPAGPTATTPSLALTGATIAPPLGSAVVVLAAGMLCLAIAANRRRRSGGAHRA